MYGLVVENSWDVLNNQKSFGSAVDKNVTVTEFKYPFKKSISDNALTILFWLHQDFYEKWWIEWKLSKLEFSTKTADSATECFFANKPQE